MITDLPPRDEMMAAFLGRDAAYDGVFVTAVTTTGIFCRPTCPARKPKPDNVEFYRAPGDALVAGYRPCRRCRPLALDAATPAWVDELLAEVEADPLRRWRDHDLRQRGLDPDTVRRWFVRHHGITFHTYHRSRRLGLALGRIRSGDDVTTTAFDAGYDSLSGFSDAFRQLFGDPPTRTTRTVVQIQRIPTPLGPMVAGATDTALVLLEFGERRMLATQLERLRRRLGCAMVPGSNPVTALVAAEIEGYFAGTLERFTVPIEDPGTDFQRTVWAALRAIPYATTTTYRDLARAIGRPSAVRAVARANGDNRLAVIIPCHRVVGADGSLTGYGGGLWRKQRLLELERTRRD